MNAINKFLISIPMALCWLYFMSGVVTLFAAFIGIYLSVFFPNMPYITNILPNLIDLMNTLGNNGLIGLMATVIFIGQYFLPIAYIIFLKNITININLCDI